MTKYTPRGVLLISSDGSDQMGYNSTSGHYHESSDCFEYPKTPYLKCPYDQIFDFHFFTFLCTIRPSYSSCQISIHYEHQKSFYFNIYFREFTAAINQPCSKAWLQMGEVTSKTQTYLTGSEFQKPRAPGHEFGIKTTFPTRTQ